MIDGNQYRTYFKRLAETHPLLLHSEENLSFAEVSVEEAIGDLRLDEISASGYIMRLVRPSYRFTPQEQQPRQTFQGGFLIARTYNVNENGSQDYRDAMDGSEAICLDILEKMYADDQEGMSDSPFEGQLYSNLNVTATERPVAGDHGFGGWIFLFTLPLFYTYCTPADRVAWTDGGLTVWP